MSWMAKLYETYEAGMQLDLSGSDQLMPISHSLQNAHIKITIDGDGNFKHAEVLEKTQIVLPATEQSASRSSGEAPHPLADKIQYVAKDYVKFGGRKKAYFKGYQDLLKQWNESSNTHDKARAVEQYIEKGCVVRDLIENNILFTDDKHCLLLSWPKDSEEKPPSIFRVLPKEKGQLDQGNALVCWNVEIPGDLLSETWKDQTLQKSWVDFELSKNHGTGFCYITGKQQTLATNHPAKLRHTGDKAKLVSANDLSGFTFRGRFTDSKESIKKHGAQPVGIAFEVTQKAHNALRWLISRQGFRNGDQVIICWAISGKDIPPPMADTLQLLKLDFDAAPEAQTDEISVDHVIDLGFNFASSLRKYMAGYSAKFDETDNIIIMGIDSATPGRMAITYYQAFSPQQYIEQISRWHEDFAWYQRHKQDKATIWPVSAPAPWSICEAIYGNAVSDGLKKNTIERLLPCIVEEKTLPRDLVDKAVHRVSNPNAYKKDDQWQWEKHLGIACALYRGYRKRQPNQLKEYKMALEENNHSRDYLYGRLLAIAERIEEIALSVAGEKRNVTAIRLMQRFADHPATTWRTIELSLVPYQQRLTSRRAGFLHNILKLLDDVMSGFSAESFNNDKALSGEFLLAFHSQRLELRKKTPSESNTESEEL